MKRAGDVYVHDRLAGSVWQDEEGYGFAYDPAYLTEPDAPAVSLTLPKRRQPYLRRTMIPFFDGLIPEGWLLALATKTWDLDLRDRMGLLLTVCEDTIGAVTVRRSPSDDE